MNTSIRPHPSAHAGIPRLQADQGGAPADDAGMACGWYESSFALRQGLAVSELPDSDGSLAALWFAAGGSASLQ